MSCLKPVLFFLFLSLLLNACSSNVENKEKDIPPSIVDEPEPNQENPDPDGEPINLPPAPEFDLEGELTIEVGQSFFARLVVSNIENAEIVFSAENIPSWIELNLNERSLSGVPTLDDIGVYSDILITVDFSGSQYVIGPYSIEVLSNQLNHVVVTWEPVNQNVNGDSIDNIASYIVRWQMQDDEEVFSKEVTGQLSQSTQINDLSSGTYNFSVSALTSSGLESDASSTWQVTIGN